MRRIPYTLAAAGALAVAMWSTLAVQQPAAAPAGAAFQYIGPLAMGPGDTLFAADSQDVSITALQLGSYAEGGAHGTKDVAGLDQQIAALLGTDRANITITDMRVFQKTGNTFISVMRGQGASGQAALVRVDGAGTLTGVPLEKLQFSKLKLPNAPDKITSFSIGAREFAIPNYPDRPKTDDRILNLFGTQTITDMAYFEGRLYVTGLSNEEFASTLRSIPFPFKTAPQGTDGTGVEIWHGSHGQFETRSPIYSFVPYKMNNAAYIIASYLCTPLVKIPVASLKPGAHVRGETIAEFGNMNRPLDMIVYTKGGQDYLLMSNNMRGVMKVPTAGFASATPIVARVGNKAGVEPEAVPSLKGVEQLDLLDRDRALLLVRNEAGALNLAAVPLP